MVSCTRFLSLTTLLVFLLSVFLIRASDARKARVLEPLSTSSSAGLQDISGRNATQIERRTLKGGGGGGGSGGGGGGGGGRGGSPSGRTRGRIVPIANGGSPHGQSKHNAAARTSSDPLIVTISSIIFGIAIVACV